MESSREPEAANGVRRTDAGRAWAPLLFVACITGAFLVPFAVAEFRTARDHAIRAYVLSVCSAVEDYRLQHGQYPPALGEIDRSRLDYDMGVALEELDYWHSGDGYQVTYRRPGREEIAGP